MLAIVIFVGGSSASFAQLPSGNWQYHWGDEFQGPTLDTTKWSYNYPWGTTHNHLAVMSSNNVLFGDGTLTLRAQRNGSTNTFTSGAISSGYNRFTVDGGYIEARIRLPTTAGSWPAFWGLQDGWPPEADIMEYPIDTAAGVGYARDQYHTAWHYSTATGNAAGAGQVNPTSVGNLDGTYHTFGMLWNSDQSATFFFNGQQVSQFNNPAAIAQMENMYLILNYAVGGWPGTPNLSEWGANHFDDMKVDWVRVWKAGNTMSTAWNYSGAASTVSWDTSGNWSNGAANLGGVTASFGTRATAPIQNLDWSGRRTMTTMNLDGTTRYRFGGTDDRLVLGWGSGGTVAPSINIAATSTQVHEVQSQLEFVGGLSINNNSNESFRLLGTLMGQGGINVNGTGVVVFEGNNAVFGGDTIIDSGAAGPGIARVRSQNPFGPDNVIIGSSGNATTGRLELENTSLVANSISLNGRGNNSVGIQNNSGDNSITGTIRLGVGGSQYRIASNAGLLTLSGSGAGGVALTGVATSNRTVTLQGDGDGLISGNVTNGSAIIGITKEGNGTWSLQGLNSHTGATNINAGTLKVSGTGSIDSSSGIIVNGTSATYLHTSSVASNRNITLTRGTIDGTGTLGAVTVADHASNIIANGDGGTGTLNASSLVFNGDGAIHLSLNTGVGLNVTGTLSTTPANGTVTINASKAIWSLGSHPLIAFGSLGGNIADFTLGTVSGIGARQSTGGLSVSGNTIAININGDLPIWTGINGSAWTTSTVGDHSGSNNWATSAAQTATNFWTTDTAQFNDTYDLGAGVTNVANRIVNIQGSHVSPGSVTFNNSAGDYTLSSSTGHGIQGTTGLTKLGSSSLVITNINTYTGSTTIQGGVLRIGDGSTDGSIATTSNISNNGSLVYNLVGSQSFGKVISGTGNLSKEGAGTLTLSETNTYQGGTTIHGGAVTLSGAGTLGSGNIHIGSGASLNLNRSSAHTTSVAVSGGGSITNTQTHTITGDFSGFNGTYTHHSMNHSTALNSVNATSANASYVVASTQGGSQGLIAGGNGDYTLKMGSLSGVAGSLVRGGNTATGTTTLEIGNLNSDTTFAGSINNGSTKSIALTKVGSGQLTLSGSNNYSGSTQVNAGTLHIAGGLNNSSSVNVASGATLFVGTNGTVSSNVNVSGTLAGTGVLSGGVTVQGTHSVGNSPGEQFFANLTYNGGVLEWELIGNTTFGRGTNFDAITGIGAAPRTLTFSNAPVSSLVFNQAGSTVDWTNPFWSTNQSWSVFENFDSIVGTPFSIGSISADKNNLAFGQGLTAGGSFKWMLDGSRVVLQYNAVAVPEPSTFSMSSAIVFGAILYRRKRAKQSERIRLPH